MTRAHVVVTGKIGLAAALGAALSFGASTAADAIDEDAVDDALFSFTPVSLDAREAPAPRFVDDVPDTLALVPRTAWDSSNAATGLRPRSGPLSASSFIVVHHSDFEGSPGPQAILDYHRQEAGFSDIGYHVVVGVDGRVYEARALDIVGAHAGITKEQRRDARLDPDEDSIGVVLDGDYEHALPPPAQLAAAAAAIADLRRRYGIPARQVIGHRDVKAHIVEARGLHLKGTGTVCPGDAAYDVLPALRLLSEP